MGIFNWFRRKLGSQEESIARMLPLDWLEGKRAYRTTKPRKPSSVEAARGPRTRASFEEVKFHVGQDLVGAVLSGDQDVIAKVQRIYSLSSDELTNLSHKIKENADIEAEIDVFANRIYWEGRG